LKHCIVEERRRYLDWYSQGRLAVERKLPESRYAADKKRETDGVACDEHAIAGSVAKRIA